MKGALWKWSGALLVFYALIAGMLLPVPRLPILNETIRNLYFHVGMWFAMLALWGGSAWFALIQLKTSDFKSDLRSNAAAEVGFVFGILGLLTGMLWAQFTWGKFWVNDPKLNGTAMSLLMYMAYFVLRTSIDDPHRRARLSAVYNLFAFVLMIVFIQVLPRFTDSLHPGNGGNPAFSQYDLDSGMRLVFYPAMMGWILLGYWILDLRSRIGALQAEART
jgi:heme exporter protein C